MIDPSLRRLRAASLALAGALLGSAPAAAQDYPARTIGAWTVAVSQDGGGCFVTRQYDGEGATTLLLGLEVDGSNHLSVLNDHWSIKPKARLTLDFRLSNGRYARHVAIGLEAEGKRGFVTEFEAKFPSYLATSKFLNIARGAVPVEQLDLAGSGAAVAELRRCVWILKKAATPAAPAAKRARRIPRDPFATDSDARGRD